MAEQMNAYQPNFMIAGVEDTVIPTRSVFSQPLDLAHNPPGNGLIEFTQALFRVWIELNPVQGLPIHAKLLGNRFSGDSPFAFFLSLQTRAQPCPRLIAQIQSLVEVAEQLKHNCSMVCWISALGSSALMPLSCNWAFLLSILRV